MNNLIQLNTNDQTGETSNVFAIITPKDLLTTENIKNLRSKYEALRNEIFESYNYLIKKKEYDFTKGFINECEEKDRETVKNLIEEEDFCELSEYDFCEFLERVYYNDKSADEKMCYLLRANNDGGLYVLDEEDHTASYISFSDLNGLNSKLIVIDEILNTITP